jgi:hypothetical protein
MALPDDPSAKAPKIEQSESEDLTPHPRYDEQLEGDAFEVMRKYQVVTLPPNARLKLMQIKLPEAPRELLEDTLPPNGSVSAPQPPELDDAHRVDNSGAAKSAAREPREQKQHGRTVVILALGGGVALLLLILALAMAGRAPSATDVTEQPPAPAH